MQAVHFHRLYNNISWPLFSESSSSSPLLLWMLVSNQTSPKMNQVPFVGHTFHFISVFLLWHIRYVIYIFFSPNVFCLSFFCIIAEFSLFFNADLHLFIYHEDAVFYNTSTCLFSSVPSYFVRKCSQHITLHIVRLSWSENGQRRQ